MIPPLKEMRKKARSEFSRAKRTGELVPPECCQNCGSRSPISAHHEDYDKPLEVVWLCDSCHGKANASRKATESELKLIEEYRGNENQSGDDMLSLGQVAEILNVSRSAAKRFTKLGKIKSLSVTSHSIRVRRSDLQRFIEES